MRFQNARKYPPNWVWFVWKFKKMPHVHKMHIDYVLSSVIFNWMNSNRQRLCWEQCQWLRREATPRGTVEIVIIMLIHIFSPFSPINFFFPSISFWWPRYNFSPIYVKFIKIMLKFSFFWKVQRSMLICRLPRENIHLWFSRFLCAWQDFVSHS